MLLPSQYMNVITTRERLRKRRSEAHSNETTTAQVRQRVGSIHKKAEKRRYQTPPAECSPRADNTSAFISGAGLSRSATFPTMLVRKVTSLPPSSSFVVPEECLCHSVARYMDGWFLKTNQIPWTDTESCEVQQTELKLFQPAPSPNALLQCYAIIDRPIQIIQTRRWSWKEKHN